MKAEILINGPFGQSFATIEVCADGSISLQAAEVAMLYALNLYNQLEQCGDCGHALSRHGAAGCDVERGDQEVDGCLQAMGPCGCKR